jgi:hypothetical protein
MTLVFGCGETHAATTLAKSTSHLAFATMIPTKKHERLEAYGRLDLGHAVHTQIVDEALGAVIIASQS